MLGRSQATLSSPGALRILCLLLLHACKNLCVCPVWCTGRYVLHPSGLTGHSSEEYSSTWPELHWSTTRPHHPSNTHPHNLSSPFSVGPSSRVSTRLSSMEVQKTMRSEITGLAPSKKAQDPQPLVFFQDISLRWWANHTLPWKKLLISHTDQLHGPGILLIKSCFCQYTLHKQSGWVSSAINSVWLTGAYQFNMEHVHVRERGNWKAAEQWVYRFWYVMHGFEWYLQRCIV